MHYTRINWWIPLWFSLRKVYRCFGPLNWTEYIWLAWSDYHESSCYCNINVKKPLKLTYTTKNVESVELSSISSFGITLSTWSKWHFKCVEICKEVLAIGHESFRLCKLMGTLRMIFNRLTDIFVSTELIFLFIHCYFSWNSPPFLKLNWQVCIKDSHYEIHQLLQLL